MVTVSSEVRLLPGKDGSKLQLILIFLYRAVAIYAASLLARVRTDSTSLTFFRQRIADFLLPRTDSCIVSIGGGGKCCSRHSGTRSLPFLRCLRPRVSTGDYAGNLTNWRENTRCAARSPASGATRSRRSRPAVQAGTATNRHRRCRLRPTFKGVMRWRMKDPSELAMHCRLAQGELWRIDYLGRNYHPAENRIIEAIAMASHVTTLKLWKVLQKGDGAQRELVKSLANDAGAILDRVIETFPTYTLHNSTHAWNVAELMAELLGPRLPDLSPLEAAMLILSAYWHDTGMVFNESERTALESEPYWRTFLTENPEAEVALEGAGELSMEIAEWYCRWRHADRVYVHLNNLPPGRLQWGRINIREALGELCRSHNLDVAEIKISDALQNNYLEAADLKFCAILLRLADILDFDNSRSPDAVYQMLGLARRKDKRAERSDVEWLKHLDSDGFRFPEQRDASYCLGFLAGPSHPAVEHDIRKFLDVIEREFDQCKGLLPFLEYRWRSFILPGEINRENIKSNGYRYGEYHFLLDQTQVLNLLMGENLYEDRHVFVRELLQNAIDTSRYREFSERVHGNSHYRAKPIRVSEWQDPEGRLWIRFDDVGMGMDEPIIRNHLLRVGSSYYQTAKFRADVIRAQERSPRLCADQPIRDRAPVVLHHRRPGRDQHLAPRHGGPARGPGAALPRRPPRLLHAPDRQSTGLSDARQGR